MAEAGGGTFTSADSKSELESYFKGEYSELQKQWRIYSVEEQYDVGVNQTRKKNGELQKVIDQFTEMRDREGENVRKAIDYLTEKEKDQGIEFVIDDRYDKLHDYFWNRFSELESEIHENSLEKQKEIDDEAQKNQDELERKKEEHTEDK